MHTALGWIWFTYVVKTVAVLKVDIPQIRLSPSRWKLCNWIGSVPYLVSLFIWQCPVLAAVKESVRNLQHPIREPCGRVWYFFHLSWRLASTVKHLDFCPFHIHWILCYIIQAILVSYMNLKPFKKAEALIICVSESPFFGCLLIVVHEVRTILSWSLAQPC